MQLRAAVPAPRQAATAKHPGLHAEIAAVLLHQDVRGHLGSTEKGMLTTVNRHRLINAVGCIRVAVVDFPAGFLLHQGQVVRSVAINLVGARENEEVAPGQYRRVASRSTSVPLALTEKSIIGSRAAQSCDGWRAV